MTFATLALAGIAWLLGNHIQTPQPFTMTFEPSGGSASVDFLPQEWANSPICSCNGGWRGIGLPVNQFDMSVAGKKPWSLMIGPMDHSVPANWWPDPEGFMSSFSLAVKHGERTIYEIKNAYAGLTLESTGPAVGVLADRSQFSAVMPADRSRTEIRSELLQLDGEPGALLSMKIDSQGAAAQGSDYGAPGEYDAGPVGSNFRATIVDTLGPRVSVLLGGLQSQSEPGSFRLWVGMHEIKLPARGTLELVIRTDFAIRFRPLPFDHTTIVGDEPGGKWSLPLVARSIPSHQIRIDHAVSFGGASWTDFVKRATSGGPPISLPERPTVFAYGRLGEIDSSSFVGTILSPGPREVAEGDRVHLESAKGFDFTQKPVALLAASSEQSADSQYLHGRATGRVETADAPSGVDGAIDWLRGSSVTRTEWLILVAKALIAVAGTMTIWELLQLLSARRSAVQGSARPPVSSIPRPRVCCTDR